MAWDALDLERKSSRRAPFLRERADDHAVVPAGHVDRHRPIQCSHWRDCHFADALSPSPLKNLLTGEGVQNNGSLADGYTGRPVGETPGRISSSGQCATGVGRCAAAPPAAAAWGTGSCSWQMLLRSTSRRRVLREAGSIWAVIPCAHLTGGLMECSAPEMSSVASLAATSSHAGRPTSRARARWIYVHFDSIGSH